MAQASCTAPALCPWSSTLGLLRMQPKQVRGGGRERGLSFEGWPGGGGRPADPTAGRGAGWRAGAGLGQLFRSLSPQALLHRGVSCRGLRALPATAAFQILSTSRSALSSAPRRLVFHPVADLQALRAFLLTLRRGRLPPSCLTSILSRGLPLVISPPL